VRVRDKRATVVDPSQRPVGSQDPQLVRIRVALNKGALESRVRSEAIIRVNGLGDIDLLGGGAWFDTKDPVMLVREGELARGEIELPTPDVGDPL
jgi:hypothetical protein